MSPLLHLFRLAGPCGTNPGGLPSLYQNVPCVNGNPQLSSAHDILVIVGNVAQILIALSGMVAVLAIIAGGAIWIVSGGDPGRIKLGRDVISNAVAGLIIILVAYAVVTFIANGF